ncbi:MAG: flagellar brake protein [Chromatiales bacterium]|nr:flagellar brake protein [Chromatiales bacterium]
MDQLHHEPILLRVGDTLHLQIPTALEKGRFNSRLIGFMEGRSLIITTPTIGGKVMIVREGQVFNVRTLSGSDIYAFTTTVLKTNTQPYPYLHLKYPSEIEVARARNSLRVAVNLPTSVLNTNPKADKAPKSGVIKDISATGALVECDKPLGEPNDLLLMSLDIRIGGVPKKLKAPSVIRNVRVLDEDLSELTLYRVGVQFQIVDPNDVLALHGYVFQQIAMNGQTRF